MPTQVRPSPFEVKGSAKFDQEELDNMRKEILENKKARLSQSIKNYHA